MLLHLKHEGRTVWVAQKFEISETMPAAVRTVSKKADAEQIAAYTKEA